MRNAMIALATLLVGVSLGLPSFAAAWATPGAACTQEGANANSDGFLTCTGGVWVSNAVLLGTTSATCDSTKAGYIRYTGGQFEGCNGTGWIQLASSSSLKVYKADGVTVLGNYMGNYAAGCGGIVYADSSTGVVSSLDNIYCSNLVGNTYFSGSNCSGTTWIGNGNMSYCGTGAANNTTTVCVYSAGPASYSYNSIRNSAGICTNTSNTGSISLVKPSICGNGPCLVK